MPDCDVLVVGAGRAGTAAARAAEDSGLAVTVLEKTAGSRASRLVTEAGRVTGVVLEDGRSFSARRRVVLATGGYESDPVLTRRFEDVPDLQSAYPPGATGDGLRMGGAVGACVHLVRNNPNIKLGYRRAGAFVTATEELARAHAIVVNRFGRRFGNDADPRELAPALRAFDAPTRTFTNVPCWLIYDRQYVERWGHDAAAQPVENVPISAAGLAATLERTLSVPPFFAIQLHPSITSSAGLAADKEGRVLNWRGHVIPGLYAVGRVAVHVE